MFDYVDFEMPCPLCGALVSGFRTKSTDCFMETVSPQEAHHFYSSCPKCEVWITLTHKPLPEGLRVELEVERIKKADTVLLRRQRVLLNKRDDGWEVEPCND